jgi:hypothetical protein
VAVKGSSVLASALLAVVLVFAGMWALDNTAVGLSIKCRVFNDLGACFLDALTQPYTPPAITPVQPQATETSEERAAREAAEEQERRDEAVREADYALGQAIDALTSNADDLSSSAADIASSVDDVRDAVSDMDSAYDDFIAETNVRPMDDYQKGSVCAELGYVEAALGGVEASQGGFDAAFTPYDWALSERADTVAAVEIAMEDLSAAVAANPDGIVTGSSTAPYSAEDAQAALDQTAQAADASATKAAKAKSGLASLLKSANKLMSKANATGTSVAQC